LAPDGPVEQAKRRRQNEPLNAIPE
jgi:hypothetical protein